MPMDEIMPAWLKYLTTGGVVSTLGGVLYLIVRPARPLLYPATTVDNLKQQFSERLADKDRQIADINVDRERRVAEANARAERAEKLMLGAMGIVDRAADALDTARNAPPPAAA